jgi:hypothetical protein
LLLRLERISTINQVIVSSTEALLLAFIYPLASGRIYFLSVSEPNTENFSHWRKSMLNVGFAFLPVRIVYQIFPKPSTSPYLVNLEQSKLTISRNSKVLLSNRL